MGMMKEFKDFAMRGNVVDLAVGVIIGGAFGKIVSSMVSDILMPPIGMLTGGVKFEELKFILKDAVTEGDKVTEAVTINYGVFIDTVIQFLIVAFCIFMVIKGMNSMKKKEEAAPAEAPAPPAPSKEELLLAEIRDELRKRNA